MTRLAITASVIILGYAASAQAEQSKALTYADFEAAVPHVDLENCPAAMAAATIFCRATIQHEEIHVFAFSEEGDQPLVGFHSFAAEGLESLLN